MYKLDFQPPSEKESVSRRRRLDHERKIRIFDDKVRTIGIDKEALDEQIKIKNSIKNEEKLRDLRFGTLLLTRFRMLAQQFHFAITGS